MKSYEPFVLSFQGQMWRYDKSASADVNYFALKKLVMGTKKFSRMQLFVNDAMATGEGAVTGARWGAVIAGIVGMAIGVNLPVGLVLVILGIGGGGVIGDVKSDNALANKLLLSPTKVSCDKKAGIFTIENSEVKAIAPKEKSSSVAAVNVRSGSKLSLNKETEDILNLFAGKCFSGDLDAETFNKQLGVAQDQVKLALGDKAAPITVVPPVGSAATH